MFSLKLEQNDLEFDTASFRFTLEIRICLKLKHSTHGEQTLEIHSNKCGVQNICFVEDCFIFVKLDNHEIMGFHYIYIVIIYVTQRKYQLRLKGCKLPYTGNLQMKMFSYQIYTF